MTNSKQKGAEGRAKGAEGERRAAEALRSLGFSARRGQQFSGAHEQGDLVHELEGIHFEVKYCKKCGSHDLKTALTQAASDAKGRLPIVLYKIVSGRSSTGRERVSTPWLVIHALDDWPDIAKLVAAAK